ncbi:cyclase [Jatrophihabitans endophyticus]|uniref:Cyclase n=1 Tax=Jatrophihabitans endophyticus TaxID=1206085 RepID=A0A1M5RQ15_9ACTN|nr:MBL fold metallo-hydrolase [Jatrophihabitans endophyticus]SHH28221.1 cyclase [Jatrophihabitans endophyticus]
MTWDDGSPHLRELAPGVLGYLQPTGGWMVNNCGVVTDAAGDVLLIDTTSTEKRTRALLAATAGVATRPPRFAVNTHHHPDHTYGNGCLPATTVVVGHRLARDGVLRAGLAATAEIAADYGELTVRAPELTFTDGLTLHLADFAVDLITMGPAHTPGDVAVWLPSQRVLFAGDLVTSGSHPMFLEGSMHGFRTALTRLRALDPVALLPGHGPACVGDDVARVLDELIAYVDWTAELATSSRADGLTPLEAARRVAGDDPYRDWSEGERVVGNLTRAYVELTDYRPDVPLTVPGLMAAMVELNGGPIASHA